MNDDRRSRAKAIARSALARKAEDRSRFLREACANDRTLLSEVESLLDSYERLRSRVEAEAGAVIGKKIGKFEVLERVGQGAMGVVYKARDPLMRRIVAIKTMSAEIATDPELHDRFYREAHSAGNLSHKNIITIFDLGEEGKRPYIAMELLLGEDLKTKLDRRMKLSLEERFRWMRETLEGLEHAHGKDVIHRDIKPANVFITSEGEVKILDFGLARLTSSVATKSGLVMGTPSYMSPEQVRGEKVDRRSDLFSAGATFYELLSFRKPFPGDTIHGVFFKILETHPEPLGRVNPSLPDDLVSVVEKLMTKNLETRYQSASDALSDLRRFEASLGERKRQLRVRALEALGRVESLLAKHRELASREEAEASLSDERTISMPIPGPLPGEDPDESPTVDELLPTDYFGLALTVSRAREEAERLESEMAKLESAHRLMEEAASHEAGGDLGGALAKADEALRLVPAHARAAAWVDRLSPLFAARNPSWTEARVDQLLREGEARLRAGALAAAAERAERALALGSREGPRALKTRVEAELERQRQDRLAAERRAQLVSGARAKLSSEDDPEGCLALVSQALELDDSDSDARDLKARAENELARRRALATEETAAEAIASATLAMRRGDLELAEREIARAARESPGATEVPALTLLLEKARRTATETPSVVTARKREAAPPPKIPPKPEPRRSPSWTPWMLGAASAAFVALLGFASWRAMSTGGMPVVPHPPESTSSVPPVSTTAVVPVASTSSMPAPAPPPSTIASTSPSSVASSSSTSSTTSSAPPSTSSTVTVSTTSAPATTTATPPPPVRPEEQISDLMRRYEAAYESLDVSALGAIYPAVPLAVKNSFQNFESLELRMEPVSGPEVSRSTAGPTATAVYRIEQTVEPKVGKKTVSRHRATFLFAGVGSAWIIVRVDWEPE